SQGWPVHVCDIDPTRGDMALALGAVVHATPAQAVAALAPGGLLVVAVVDAAQCREVLWGEGGAAAALQPGQAVMWCPTIAPADLESLAERLATQGVDSLDAPMSGGPARARDGSMSLLLAGADTVVQRYARVLAALSGQVVRLGERLGDGARTKLVNNLLAGINLVGAAEAMALAHNLGLDAQRTLEVIERSSGQSWIGSDRLPRALAGDLLPRAHMTLLAKDTRLACEAASAAGFAGPLGERVASVFRMACEGGLSELDDAAMLIFLQQTGQSR
ncbi:MAG: NAD(P)-dependent oxidoreductase, partial [Burkholderiaceae bacterium]|nr:NAD(P)-dependent oxidoreductase [Burkholderiaceae bacterium]